MKYIKKSGSENVIIYDIKYVNQANARVNSGQKPKGMNKKTVV